MCRLAEYTFNHLFLFNHFWCSLSGWSGGNVFYCKLVVFPLRFRKCSNDRPYYLKYWARYCTQLYALCWYHIIYWPETTTKKLYRYFFTVQVANITKCKIHTGQLFSIVRKNKNMCKSDLYCTECYKMNRFVWSSVLANGWLLSFLGRYSTVFFSQCMFIIAYLKQSKSSFHARVLCCHICVLL